MYRQTMNTIKGIGMGVLAGTVVAAVGTKALNGGRKKMTGVKRSTAKAIHTVGSLMGDVEKMLK